LYHDVWCQMVIPWDFSEYTMVLNAFDLCWIFSAILCIKNNQRNLILQLMILLNQLF